MKIKHNYFIKKDCENLKSLLSFYVFSKHLYVSLSPSYVWAYEEIKDYF
jgi:hypothetical protein